MTLCQGKPAWTERWGSNAVVMAELEKRPEWCLDMTFMHALLRVGYGFDSSRELMIGQRVDGTEMGWFLGATLAMIGGDLKCRA